MCLTTMPSLRVSRRLVQEIPRVGVVVVVVVVVGGGGGRCIRLGINLYKA